MANSRPFLDHVVELMQAAGRVDVRAMFGGHGVYIDGLIVAIVIDDLVYLKSDDDSAQAFEAQSLPAFEYVTRDGRRALTSYRLAPDEALESADAMREWLRLAQEAALRARAAKPAKRSPRRPVKRPA